MRLTPLALGFLLASCRVFAAPVDLIGGIAPGAEPANLLPLVGTWSVQQDGPSAVVVVDGSKWREGTAATKVDAHAAEAFPSDDKRFADAVKQHASFPLAVARNVASFEAGTVTVRFKPVAGREDQAAGIAFAIEPSGDYLILRANGLENNLILFQFKNGRRSALKEVRVQAPRAGQWHELKLVVQQGTVRGWMDGKQHLEFQLKQPVRGRLGLWSKADSVVQFRDFDVQPGN
ncbi:MAG: hypothetical protein JWQ33_3155 [Ramlibacter sp.]|nr:hypothetical protein [Ramlibacter sp.]